MSRWKVLITAPRAAQALPRYEAALAAAGCEVITCFPRERLGEDELLPLLADIDGIICGDDFISARVLEAAPRLRVISKWGTGIDSIDVGCARSRGVIVCNSPGAFSDAVADTVLGYVLLFARQLDHMAEDMRSGLWRRIPLVSLSECTLGIVGYGSIGVAVARRAAAFGMRILITNLNGHTRDVRTDTRCEMLPLESLLAQSDFVTLHADLREDNRHLVDASRLSLMKPTAVVINTARGALLDEQALIGALQKRRLAGAALDVFAEEPLPPDSPLRRMKDVYLAPHNANASALAAERVHANSINNLLQALRSEIHR